MLPKLINKIKIHYLFHSFLFIIIIIIKNLTKIICYLFRYKMIKIYLFFLFLKLYKEKNDFVMKTVFYMLTIANYLFSKIKMNILFESFTKEIVEMINFYKESLILQTKHFVLSILRNLLTDPEIMNIFKSQMSEIVSEFMVQQKKDQYTEIILYSTSESILKFGLQYLIRFGVGNEVVYQTITND